MEYASLFIFPSKDPKGIHVSLVVVVEVPLTKLHGTAVPSKLRLSVPLGSVVMGTYGRRGSCREEDTLTLSALHVDVHCHY